jgi:hypothetical protein
VVVAGLLGDILFHQPARGLEIQHEDLRLQAFNEVRSGSTAAIKTPNERSDPTTIFSSREKNS